MDAGSDTPFYFHTKLEQTLLLGIGAKSVKELLRGLQTVPDTSVYFHTHRFLLQHQYLSPEPPNDFAYWVTEIMGNAALGERLASIDLVQFDSIAALRGEFVKILEEYVASGEYRPETDHGDEFHFMASRTFVIPTPFVAHTVGEFRETLGKVSFESLYYHIFDAKLRIGRGENDFSLWLRDRGRGDIADKIRGLDPYAQTMDGLRKRILALLNEHD